MFDETRRHLKPQNRWESCQSVDPKGMRKETENIPTQGYKLRKNRQDTFPIGERKPLKGQSKNPCLQQFKAGTQTGDSIKLSV